MSPQRSYLPPTLAALQLLSMQIGVARRERGWTEHELAERAGVSRQTLRNVEAGSPTVGIGIVFDIASLAGVELFHPSAERVRLERARMQDRLALLPDQVHRRRGAVRDDF